MKEGPPERWNARIMVWVAWKDRLCTNITRDGSQWLGGLAPAKERGRPASGMDKSAVGIGRRGGSAGGCGCIRTPAVGKHYGRGLRGVHGRDSKPRHRANRRARGATHCQAEGGHVELVVCAEAMAAVSAGATLRVGVDPYDSDRSWTICPSALFAGG